MNIHLRESVFFVYFISDTNLNVFLKCFLCGDTVTHQTVEFNLDCL